MTNKVFLNRKFFFYVKRSNILKSAELIKLFGGQIEQFLEQGVSYVLTDVPREEWPPRVKDSTLERAQRLNVKLMSLHDLIGWCSKYISSQSNSDDDEDIRAAIREIKPPYIKVEDYNCQYAPSVKEFLKWPEISINLTNLPVGKSFFSDSVNLLNSTPNQSTAATNNFLLHPNNSAQLTQQATSMQKNTTTATNQNNIPQRGVKRRHSVFCEICNIKVTDKIEEHIQTQAHKNNTEKLNWTEVSNVIDSLPSLSTLNMRRLSSLTPPNGIEHNEFLCLHKVVESVDQLFNG